VVLSKVLAPTVRREIVNRIIKHLVAIGYARTTLILGHTYYVPASLTDNAYFYCYRCQRVDSFTGQLSDLACQPPGFQPQQYQLCCYGICAACQQGWCDVSRTGQGS
jgi:Fe2+ or Zn2+ uptake regulation protein